MGVITKYLFIALILFGMLRFGVGTNDTVEIRMIIFGDSVVDVGNNNYRRTTNIARANYPPYGVDFFGQKPTGRHSNGRLLVDMLASVANLRFYPPPYLRANDKAYITGPGVNIASASSGLLDNTGKQYGNVISLSEQFLLFNEDMLTSLKKSMGSKKATLHVKKSLFHISVGTNDIAEHVMTGYNLTNDFRDNLLGNYTRFLQNLYGSGARFFSVTDIPALGCTPYMRAHFKQKNNSTCVYFLNKWIHDFNEQLRTELDKFQSEFPESKFHVAPMFNATYHISLNPIKYGFKKNEACCGAGLYNGEHRCTSTSNICKHTSDYVWFDAFHPSDHANRWILSAMFKCVYPPKPKSPSLSTVKELVDLIFNFIEDIEKIKDGGTPPNPSPNSSSPSPDPDVPYDPCAPGDPYCDGPAVPYPA